MKVLLRALPFVLPAVSGFAGVYPANFTEKIVASGIISPSGMDFAADGRLFIGEQKGKIKLVRNDSLIAQPVLNIQTKTDYNTERGLQGIVLDPDFAVNGYLYVYYTARLPAPHNRLSRFTIVNNVADTAETVIFALPNLPARSAFGCINVNCNGASAGTTTLSVWHMGGALAFGNDGKIYLGVGDHEVMANAQSMATVFGKILRLNADGGIPVDNPFYGTATGNNRAIYALGMRHPYTMAVQRGTGRIFLNDVGDATSEEVDTLVAGGNYGWSTCEGNNLRGSASSACTNASFVKPLFAYGHGTTTSTGNGVIGGDFSTNFRAQDNGKYFFGDFTNTTTAAHGWIKSIHPATGGDTAVFATGVSNITGLRFSPAGALYFMSRGYPTGTIDTVGTASKISRLYKVSYNFATSVRSVAALPARASFALVALDVHRSLKVPQHATAMRLYDLSGRTLWEARGLTPGATIALPGHMSRGVARAVWE